MSKYLEDKLQRAKERLTYHKQRRQRWERQMDGTNKRDKLALAGMISDERSAEYDVRWIERELEGVSVERVGAEM